MYSEEEFETSDKPSIGKGGSSNKNNKSKSLRKKLKWAVGKNEKTTGKQYVQTAGETDAQNNYDSVLRRNEARTKSIKKLQLGQDQVLREQYNSQLMSNSDNACRVRDIEELTTNSEKYLENLKPVSNYDYNDKSSNAGHNFIGDQSSLNAYSHNIRSQN